MSDSRPFAVVTGATSGIGRELARQFVTHGFDVLITSEEAGLDATAAELAGHGTTVQEVGADLATPDGAERLVAAIAATGRTVDALALNAGIGNGGVFTDIQQVLDEGAELLPAHAGPGRVFLQQRGGLIQEYRLARRGMSWRPIAST